MTKQDRLIIESLLMLKDRDEKKKKVKDFIQNPRLKNQEFYFNIMESSTRLCMELKDKRCNNEE